MSDLFITLPIGVITNGFQKWLLFLLEINTNKLRKLLAPSYKFYNINNVHDLLEEHLKISFYTATIYKWKSLLTPAKYKQIVLDSLNFLVINERIKLYGFVIMPNHIHLLMKIIAPWKFSGVQRDLLKFTG